MYDLHSKEHSNRVKIGMQKRKLQGKLISKPPFGYDKNNNPIQSEMNIIKEIIQLRNNGLSMNKISKEMLKKHPSIKFSATKVMRILKRN